jgi:hypothetical protein
LDGETWGCERLYARFVPKLPVEPVKMKVSNLPAELVKMEDTKDSLMCDPVVAYIVTNYAEIEVTDSLPKLTCMMTGNGSSDDAMPVMPDDDGCQVQTWK